MIQKVISTLIIDHQELFLSSEIFLTCFYVNLKEE